MDPPGPTVGIRPRYDITIEAWAVIAGCDVDYATVAPRIVANYKESDRSIPENVCSTDPLLITTRFYYSHVDYVDNI